MRVRDRVVIVNKDGKPIAEGTIYNINDFREPSMKYAVDVDGYADDVLFFGESQLLAKWGDVMGRVLDILFNALMWVCFIICVLGLGYFFYDFITYWVRWEHDWIIHRYDSSYRCILVG